MGVSSLEGPGIWDVKMCKSIFSDDKEPIKDTYGQDDTAWRILPENNWHLGATVSSYKTNFIESFCKYHDIHKDIDFSSFVRF